MDTVRDTVYEHLSPAADRRDPCRSTKSLETVIVEGWLTRGVRHRRCRAPRHCDGIAPPAVREAYQAI